MEEFKLLQLQINTDEEDYNPSSSNSEDFYEKIEAPKFVDFTLPDRKRYRPDDRYWFCLRVGCDQKHEEELNPEEINKNFILRVMAARSPNIRLRKNLSRRCPSAKVECPQSAPAKSSRPRISRLAVISSISLKIGAEKEKVKPPIPKTVSTPISKSNKQSSVASKALTTPRNKKCVPNPKSSQSVQIPVVTSAAIPKNTLVAKTLIFDSPKKVTKTKYSSEIDTPLRKICDGMSKLEIKSHRKRMLGYSMKSPNGFRREVRKALPVDTSSKQSNKRKLMNGAAKLVQAEKQVDKEEKSKKSSDLAQSGMEQIDCSDMDIDGKSRNNSLEMHFLSNTSKSIGENTHEEILVNEQTSSHVKAKDVEHSGKYLTEEKFTSDINGESDVNGQRLVENASVRQEQNAELSYQTSQEASHDNDDKENTSGHDNNRVQNNNKLTGKKLLGNDRTGENITQKNTWTVNKTFEKSVNATPKDVQGGILKYKKPKATHPKPFRLRTDERGILKEANMEKRLHLLDENDATQRCEKGQMKFGNGANEGNDMHVKKLIQKKHHLQQEVDITHTLSSKKVVRKTPQLNVERQATPMTNQKPTAPTFRSENPIRKKKVYVMPTPQGASSIWSENPIRKKILYAMPTPQGAIKSIRKAKVYVRNVDEHGTSSELVGAKPKVLYRSSARATRPAVISKDPHFHTGIRT